VLHATGWAADNAGTLNLLAARVGHPIATLPNAIPNSLPIAYTGFGNEDSYQAVAPAYIVYAVTTQPTNGGLLVYDNNVAPQSAQVVVFGFDFKVVSDLSTRSALLENTVVYLLADEPPPNAGITGNVHLGTAPDHSGTTVTLTPGGLTAATDAAGNYAFTNIYPGSYTLTASLAGYLNGTLSVVATPATVTAHQDLLVFPVPEVNYCVSPGLAIPDNNTTGISRIHTPVETFVVEEVQVTLNITHTYRGDLIVELKHGAKTVRLHNRTGGSADNLAGTYPTTLTVSGPGALTAFIGDTADGAWTLVVSDRAGQDTGTLVSWCLKLRGAPDLTSGVGGTTTLPQVAQLMQSRPNPVPERGTSIQFALPSAGPVSLLIFDIAGRTVRTLVQENRPAGLQAVDWDARDDEGHHVAAGVYLYKLITDQASVSRKMVVVR
jgi:subtilisin-like proprotein convertase family protein